MKKGRLLVIHPILFGLYSPLALLARNLGQIRPADATRALVVVGLASLLCLVLWGGVTRDWAKAGILASLSLILFFSYGHLYRSIEGLSVGGFLIGRHRYLVVVYLAVFAFALHRTLSAERVNRSLTRTLNVVGAISIAFPLSQMGLDVFRASSLSTVADESAAAEELGLTASADMPDIYYIILDEYARADVMDEVYGLDNSAFLGFLADRGFQILTQSRANYAQTELSFASTFNMAYLQDLGLGVGPLEADRAVLARLIRQSIVRRSLEHLGYTTVSFSSGFDWSEFRDAETFVSPRHEWWDYLLTADVATSYEGTLVQTSALVLLVDAARARGLELEYPYQMHRERVLNALRSLAEDVPRLPGPQFVFAHIIAPHGPIVFGANGEPVINPDPVRGYRDEVVFVNGLVEQTIDGILATSDSPPVIILQSDTGPAVDFSWDSPSSETLWARMTILNAIYMPGGGSADLYASMTPVNAFRVVFNRYFGTELDLLPDRSYFSNWDHPYLFDDVTEIVAPR